MSRRPKPITTRPWLWLRHSACARSWPTATVGLGTLYAPIGRREQARVALAAAIGLYRAMEMTFWLPQARSDTGSGDMSHPHAVPAQNREGAFPIHARRGACLVPSLSTGVGYPVEEMCCADGQAACQLPRFPLGGRATTLPRSGPSFLVFLHLPQEARKRHCITRAMSLRATKGMEMPPTGVISPKNSLPIFDQSKGCFSCVGIKEDVNKEKGPQMDTQFQDWFF